MGEEPRTPRVLQRDVHAGGLGRHGRVCDIRRSEPRVGKVLARVEDVDRVAERIRPYRQVRSKNTVAVAVPTMHHTRKRNARP